MRQISAIVVILAVAGVCTRFGVWQLQRLAERKAHNELVAARSELPPIQVMGANTQGLAEYRSVGAEGRFDFDRQIVRVGVPRDGVPGVVVITPLVFDDGFAILVERGWTSSPDARRVELDLLGEPRNATLAGVVLQPSEAAFPIGEDWPFFVRSVNTDSLAARYPYPLLPWVLRRTDTPEPMGAQVFRAVRNRALSNGPHLNYAVQWFSFALIALIGGSIFVFRSDRTRKLPHLPGLTYPENGHSVE